MKAESLSQTEELRSPAGSVQKIKLDTVGTYLGLMLFLVFARLVVGLIQVEYSDPSQAAIFQWSTIALLLAAGLVGALLADRTGFPSALDRAVSNRRRFAFPALIGAALGFASLAINALLHLPKVDIAFPASVFVYSAGAIAVEVIYRLLPLPLLLWLISAVILRGRAQERVFWILAILLSTLEPVAQGRALIGLGVALAPMSLTLLEIYAANLTQAYFFRKSGFLASLTIRLAHYLVWHILGSLLILG